MCATDQTHVCGLLNDHAVLCPVKRIIITLQQRTSHENTVIHTTTVLITPTTIHLPFYALGTPIILPEASYLGVFKPKPLTQRSVTVGFDGSHITWASMSIEA